MGGGGFSFLIALVVHGTEQAGPHSALGFFASACLYFTERLVTKRLTRLLIVPSYNTETVFFSFFFFLFFFLQLPLSSSCGRRLTVWISVNDGRLVKKSGCTTAGGFGGVRQISGERNAVWCIE